MQSIYSYYIVNNMKSSPPSYNLARERKKYMDENKIYVLKY